MAALRELLDKGAVRCIEMHTTGEATRIVYAGFPQLSGTLLKQRAEALAKYDHLRKRLILEPRGHFDMYGAILCLETEYTKVGKADIGVLFIHNEGYSTMCGHATLALGRYLVDSGMVSAQKGSTSLELTIHAPCGLVRVTTPINLEGRSDPNRPVSFLSIPCFATALDLDVDGIVLDVGYGGAFYALVSSEYFGISSFTDSFDIDKVSRKAQELKKKLMVHPKVVEAIRHPEDNRLSFLYGIMITSPGPGIDSEIGLCFFADNEIDRSPTGSCVCAQTAVAHAKGMRPVGKRWHYNSLVSNHYKQGAFGSEIAEELSFKGKEAVVVRVDGYAYYTGSASFTAEPEDFVTSGFIMNQLASSKETEPE